MGDDRIAFGQPFQNLRRETVVVSDLHRAHRAWPQTEALKAELAHGEFTGEWDRARIAVLTDLLLDRYLATVPAGGWVDGFDAEGRRQPDHIPASTFYHLFLAFAELLRLRPALEAEGC